VKRICKPNSVPLRVKIIHLPLALPRWSSNLPGSSDGHGRVRRFPIWSCSAGGLPCRRRSRGPRCALTAPFHPYPIRLLAKPNLAVSFCCTFRRVTAPGRYPACCPWEFGLSSIPPKRDGDLPIRFTQSIQQTTDFASSRARAGSPALHEAAGGIARAPRKFRALNACVYCDLE
jgi:hypothetical protein